MRMGKEVSIVTRARARFVELVAERGADAPLYHSCDQQEILEQRAFQLSVAAPSSRFVEKRLPTARLKPCPSRLVSRPWMAALHGEQGQNRRTRMSDPHDLWFRVNH